jgi:hypothetical protein
METKYSLKKGIFTDIEIKKYFILVIMGFATLILGLFIGFIPAAGGILSYSIIIVIDDNVSKIILIIIFGSYNIILIISCIFRIKIIKNMFYNGIETDAEIIDYLFYIDKHKFVYFYKIENINYKTTEYYEKLFPEIFPNNDYKIISNYKKGDVIKILVNPKNHKELILKDQYMEN